MRYPGLNYPDDPPAVGGQFEHARLWGKIRCRSCCTQVDRELRFAFIDIRQRNVFFLCSIHIFEVFDMPEFAHCSEGVSSTLWDSVNDMIATFVDTTNLPLVVNPGTLLPVLKTRNYDLEYVRTFRYEVDSQGETRFEWGDESDIEILSQNRRATSQRTDGNRWSFKRIGCAGVAVVVGLFLLLVVCTGGDDYDCAREGNRTFGDDAGVADVLRFMERCEN